MSSIQPPKPLIFLIQVLCLGVLILGLVSITVEASEQDTQVVPAPQLGNGMRNSWADQHSIVLWTRTTALAEMVHHGPDFLKIDREKLSLSLIHI